MNAVQENVLVILLVLGMAAVLGVVVSVLSSETLREEGFRRLMKRWLGR